MTKIDHPPPPEGIIHWRPYPLTYKAPILTSRGSLSVRETFFLIRETPEDFQIGEVGYLPGLTRDPWEDYLQSRPQKIRELQSLTSPNSDHPLFRNAPTLLFAWEMLSPKEKDNHLESRFSQGQEGIPVNGLVWMGDLVSQKKQIIDLLDRGFTTLKLKIGGLDFEKELSLIDHLFQETEARGVTPIVRLDANGAFSPENALHKLERLSQYPIHSIEQPLPPTPYRENPERESGRIYRSSPIPIALDEELISEAWIGNPAKKRHLLDELRPAYLVLKPGLHGGFSECEEWIRLAQERGMGWWVTSALESNLGLTAISLWTAGMLEKYGNDLHQGLGTGGLYQNNFISPLTLRGDQLFYHPDQEEHLRRDALKKLGFREKI